MIGNSMSSTPLDEVMQACAGDAVAYAQSKFGLVLDYSEQSIASLDGILSQMTTHGLLLPSEMTEEQHKRLWNLCQAIGAYIGVVIIKHLGGHWMTEDVGDKEVTLKLMVADRITAWPHEKVWKRLTESEFDMIIGYYRGLQQLLGVEKFVPRELKKPWWKFW